jgi:hypothetical protein
MRSNDLTHVRQDLAEWGEPIVADQLISYYARAFKGQTSLAQPMAFNHRRFWRHLFAGHVNEALTTRRELQRLGLLVGMRPVSIDELDRQVMDELMHVIMARFHRSPAVARDYSMTVLDIASRLAETRMTAAAA